LVKFLFLARPRLRHRRLATAGGKIGRRNST
jgi:hypothetical protein